MRHKTYRICLLSVVILAIVVGIFYYLNYVQDKAEITEGMLVRQEPVTEMIENAWIQKEPMTVRKADIYDRKEQARSNKEGMKGYMYE